MTDLLRGRARAALPALLVALLGLAPDPARAAQTEDLHTLDFRIHVNLIDEAAGRDLAFFEALLEEALAQSTAALQGFQGPNDVPCCTRIEPSVSLTTFGSAADGFDVVTTSNELDDLETMHGPGALIIESLEVCGAMQSPGVVGCSSTPGDFLVVDVAVEEAVRVLGLTIAHERGHNAGLLHPAERNPAELEDPCDLMAATNGGGCLDVAECSAYANEANTSGGLCRCLGSSIGDPPAADGIACVDPSGCGQCSGGVCGACQSAAGVATFASAGGAGLPSPEPRSLLATSTLTGGWRNLGEASQPITGLAYDASRGVLFGLRDDVGPGIGGADDLVKLDPETGAIIEIVDSLGREDLTALAYDPDTDALYATQALDEELGTPCDQLQPPRSEPCSAMLLRIDPDDASVIELGELPIFDGQSMEGLAYDPTLDVLFGTAEPGLLTIETSCGGVCDVELIDDVPVQDSALALDPVNGLLLRSSGLLGTRIFEAIDPGSGVAGQGGTGVRRFTMGVRGHTPAGLAAQAVSEPAELMLRLCGAGSVALLALLRVRARAGGRGRRG